MENQQDYEVITNGTPKIENISKEVWQAFISTLKEELIAYHNKQQTKPEIKDTG